MIECPVKFGDDDKWIAMSLLAFIIKTDTQIQSLEIDFLKERLSSILDSGDLRYLDELMQRDFDQDYIEKIDIPNNKIIAKYILKEAITLGFVDGDYSEEEQVIVRSWAAKNGFDESFVEDLETYVKAISKLDKIGDDLLNNDPPNDETHNFLQKLQFIHEN